MSPSSIEWTDETWNPTVGCSRVSDGCAGCYAMHQAHRGLDVAHHGLTIVREGSGVDWNNKVRLLPARLDVPLRWRRPRRVFVDSMSDLFHPQVEYGFAARVFGVMAAAPQHQFQVLTKRPRRMAKIVGDTHPRRSFEDAAREEFEARLGIGADWPGWPLPNVWLGVSIESDSWTRRVDALRSAPAAHRFISAEPLLGPLPSLDLTLIDWVIAGGESGTRARPMHPDWVRDLRDRCSDARIPFLFKQWGAWRPAYGIGGHVRWLNGDGSLIPVPVEGLTGDAVPMVRMSKKDAGRELDGYLWDGMP